MGDEIVITAMECCANIVHWQMLCHQTGAVLKIAPISGELIFSAIEKLIFPRFHGHTAISDINYIRTEEGRYI
jgi:selenocysteine lyase/cysteine desulfurase